MLRALWFALLFPVLVLWAFATEHAVQIPPVRSLPLGAAIALVGALLWLPRAARYLPYPLCTGYCIACIGVSLATGSASGLWLVSPLVILASFSLAYTIEPRDPQRPPPQLLPRNDDSTPTLADYIRFFLFMVLPWLALYEAILAIGIPPDAISGVTSFEERLPVLEWTQVFYGSVYIVVLSVPFFAKTRRDLRWFSVRGLWTMLIAYPAFLTIPLIAPKRQFIAHSIPGRLLHWEQTLDSPVAAFPSFHVIWVLLAAEVYARRWPRGRALFYLWAVLVAASCVTTSQHSILDVMGGFATVALVVRAPRSWSALPARAFVWIVLSGGFVVRLLTIHATLPLTAGIALILTALGFLSVAKHRRLSAAALATGVALTCITPP